MNEVEQAELDSALSDGEGQPAQPAETTALQTKAPDVVATEAVDDDPFATNDKDSAGIRARIGKASKKHKEAIEELARHKQESGSASAFLKRVEELGLLDEVMALVERGKSAPERVKDVPAASGQQALKGDRKGEISQEQFGASFEELAKWEQKSVMTWLREEQNEERQEAEKKESGLRDTKATLHEIVQECKDVALSGDFKEIKADPQKIYDYMYDMRLVDANAAARIVYDDELQKLRAGRIEKEVLARRNRAPASLESTSAIQPKDGFGTDDMVQDIVEELRAGGKIAGSYF